MNFVPIRATANMVVCQGEKVVTSGEGNAAQYYYASQDDVDEFIAQDLTFGQLLDDSLLSRENIGKIRFGSTEPVTLELRVDVGTIGRNSELFISPEPNIIPWNE